MEEVECVLLSNAAAAAAKRFDGHDPEKRQKSKEHPMRVWRIETRGGVGREVIRQREKRHGHELVYEEEEKRRTDGEGHEQWSKQQQQQQAAMRKVVEMVKRGKFRSRRSRYPTLAQPIMGRAWAYAHLGTWSSSDSSVPTRRRYLGFQGTDTACSAQTRDPAMSPPECSGRLTSFGYCGLFDPWQHHKPSYRQRTYRQLPDDAGRCNPVLETLQVGSMRSMLERSYSSGTGVLGCAEQGPVSRRANPLPTRPSPKTTVTAACTEYLDCS
ncbi:uncharacterized protein CLUP02_07801 [Colletotrichum lupini]|uniref:Uncharacterized protein n=1 Tax=Colletotrichum lupini TaxID=145971 RepID=A0A9Q8WGA6_9PEZI|nr:uncharacterized protein CLUP02_07801 [Colletotrichum lupini]UQC82314.1 hypothetical protein CLUP02_07801 [Colletotrichum lupini]